MDINLEVIKENLEDVQSRINTAAISAGRDPDAVHLVVVTKALPVSHAKLAIMAGAKNLGENYPEEGAQKISEICNPGVTWHMIGHIQRRKTRIVAAHYDMVHSIDSLKLAVSLNNECVKMHKVMPVLLEINVGGEESKGGWMITDIDYEIACIEEIEQILDLNSLAVEGLMAMPPLHDDPEGSRQYFTKMRAIEEKLNRRFNNTFTELSMGTSHDYTIAVQEGATYVRVGRSILGPRPAKKDQSS